MTSDQYALRLEEILQTLTGASNNTETIKLASASLKEEFLSKPTTVSLLVKIISASTQWQVRQLAAVELKKLVPIYWESLSESERSEIRVLLPNLILTETKKPPRLSISQSIGAIALIDLPQGRWNDLLGSVAQCANSENPEQRECGMLLVEVLFDVIVEKDASSLGGVFNILRNALSDPTSLNVKLSSIKTLTKLAETLKPEQNDLVASFQNIIPEVVKIVQETIAQKDVVSTLKIYELFEAGLLSEAPLLSSWFGDFANFMINISVNTSNNDEIRVGAITNLYWSAQYQKARVIKLGLVGSYLRCAMQVAVEPELEEVDEECPARSAITLVNVMATHFPASQVFEVIGPIVFEYFNNQNEGFRKAALLTLGVAAEGCSEFLCSKVFELLPFLTNSLSDSSAVVRRASCFSLYSFTDALGEEVTKFHKMILPPLFKLMSDPDPEVSKNVWNAIDSFMSEIGEAAGNYLPELMEKAGEFLNSLSNDQKVTAIAAIGSAASSAPQAFVNYLPGFMSRLKEFMSVKSDNTEEMFLRAVATDAAANIASAAGKEVMMSYIPELFEIAFEGMSIEGPHLRSSGFSMFETLSGLLGPEFAIFLEPVISQIQYTLDQTEFAVKEGDLTSGFEDNFDFHSDISDEKVVAIDTSAEIFCNIGESFLPYLEHLTQNYLRLLVHFSEHIRKSGFQALSKFIVALYAQFKTSDWVAGVPVQIALDDRVTAYINVVMPVLVENWVNEAELLVSNRVLLELEAAIQAVGPALIVDQIGPIVKHLETIFKNQAACQNQLDHQLDLEDLAEQESVLILNAADVLGAMSKAIGSEFLPLFRPFFPLLLSHFNPTLPESERSMVVATLSDVLIGLGSSLSEYTHDLLGVFLNGLQDSSPLVRSNSAFGIGLLCACTNLDISSQYLEIFTRLSPLFQNQSINTTDNACGAVCRMIKARPDSCPIDEIIPVVINNLPLKEDHAEYVPVYECIIQLLNQDHPVVLSNLVKIKSLFEHMVSETPDIIPVSLLESMQRFLA